MRRLAALLLIAVVLLGAVPRARAADTDAGASQILRATLANGLKVVIVRNTLAPVVTTVVNYLVGSNEAPAGFPGMAHAQEHMMFRGGRELSADLDLDRAITAIMTPKPSGKPVTSKAFGGKESFTLPNTKPVALPAWAESAVKRLAVPRSSVNPVVTTLPNGLRLIVQPESVSNTISVVGHMKTRAVLEAPPGQEGVDEVLEGLCDFGTESLDRVAYQKALDEIGADAGAGADFAVGVLAEHFDRGVQLLADSELNRAISSGSSPRRESQRASSS